VDKDKDKNDYTRGYRLFFQHFAMYLEASLGVDNLSWLEMEVKSIDGGSTSYDPNLMCADIDMVVEHNIGFAALYYKL